MRVAIQRVGCVCLALAVSLGGCVDVDKKPSKPKSKQNDPKTRRFQISANDEKPAPKPVKLQEGQVKLDGEDRRYALLVACSKYDYLGDDAELTGPENDIDLMRGLLVDHFGFDKQNIQVLGEREGKACRPTKKHLVREFDRFAEHLKKGDQVVVFFSGHGSQQPDRDRDVKADPEPDGLDEVFLPVDAGGEEEGVEHRGLTIPNGVSDDELRGWLTGLRKKQAAVWVIVDACHSGTVTRGTPLARGREVARQVRPEKFFDKTVLANARSAAAAPRLPGVRGGGGSAESLDFVVARNAETDQLGPLVALYAAQPHEPTYEAPLPDKDSKVRGLLTYTMVQVLSNLTDPISYNELARRIQAQYISEGRFGPTPLIEGTHCDREVLGLKQWPQRTRLMLTVGLRGRMELNAGKLHGLADDTILAVYPPPGEDGEDQLLGYLKVTKADTAKSLVSPTEHDGVAVPDDLPSGARCEVALLSYGDMRLKVAVADTPDTDTRDLWTEQLLAVSEADSSPIELVNDPAEADWLLSWHEGAGVLSPATGAGDPPLFGPIPEDESAEDWLAENLRQITRARNLLKVAGYTPGGKGRSLFGNLFKKKPLRIRAVMRKLESVDDEEGELVPWSSAGMNLKPGDIVALKVTNTGRLPCDVSVLFVDSHLGIDAMFPPPNTVTDNRIPAGESLTVGPMQVQGDSTGLEHLLIVANIGSGQPHDFSWLAQPSMQRVRSGNPTAQASVNSPLGQLFQHALYSEGATRGLKMADSQDVVMRVFTWTTDEEK